MCISEASIVAIVCASLSVVGSIVITAINVHSRSLDKYKKKQEAIFESLKFLDTYCSFLDYSSGIIPKRDNSYDSTKLTLEGRSCYERLCITIKNQETLEVFLSIVLRQSKNVMESLNTFRNLCRKELGLKEIDYNEESVFISVISPHSLEKKS